VDSAAARARLKAEDDLDTIIWHRQQGEAAEEAGEWYAAIFHFDRLTDLRPDEGNVRARRARILDKAVKVAPQDIQAWLASARVRLAVGDLVAYREACARIEALRKANTDPLLVRELTWTCALAPSALTDLGPLLKLAERDAAAPGKDRLALLALGGLLLRSGRTDDAVKRLTEALEQRGPHALPTEELLLVIAYHELKDAAKARHWLEQATVLLDGPNALLDAARVIAVGPQGLLPLLTSLMTAGPDPRERLFAWQEWDEVRALHREAEALIPPAMPR
jgi:tetratricopeptide (TPR) repeat protein